ncbi:hypothetical protein Y032_0091g2501 [Ancylostoma ceylanicum]|nr:hypothetical protein Y032_0091g2501 [Ancylostoma ceylanicum]
MFMKSKARPTNRLMTVNRMKFGFKIGKQHKPKYFRGVPFEAIKPAVIRGIQNEIIGNKAHIYWQTTGLRIWERPIFVVSVSTDDGPPVVHKTLNQSMILEDLKRPSKVEVKITPRFEFGGSHTEYTSNTTVLHLVEEAR